MDWQKFLFLCTDSVVEGICSYIPSDKGCFKFKISGYIPTKMGMGQDFEALKLGIHVS